jgi:hypothetical protein
MDDRSWLRGMTFSVSKFTGSGENAIAATHSHTLAMAVPVAIFILSPFKSLVNI